MPNVTVGADGRGSGEFALDIGSAELSELLFDADGTAMMLHADPDDYRSDPAGAAGPRIACGVLEKLQ
ncbi:Superoxide dismutase [Cu-Zn] precursor [Altererythrobacter epoxidivorans]|uniref:Superoxide dismutase [Cu-Zn] n=2 Tax=Altererythrobacter epoxidivorans TaxID=361183 RepID=A0A0M5L7L0_9SPHN|nr:Superoxide dismutase [Cu-Zn] precursor [Altererythrobacter epoxidivorans]